MTPGADHSARPPARDRWLRSRGMRYRTSEGVLHQVVDGQAMLIPPTGKEVLVLNGTGTAVWAALTEADPAGGGDAATLVAAVHAVHPDAPADTVVADVAAFLADLEAAGLIRPA